MVMVAFLPTVVLMSGWSGFSGSMRMLYDLVDGVAYGDGVRQILRRSWW